MQLTKLEIKGFKSFGDKITINFNEGVTAIVGPNGCGKSNVVDSIRWVLGEQSTRMLRSEKMENIIFNGTKTRKPANLAEVSLTFDNTKNILPTEFSHVTVTRKLYRSGESEYRLNDVQCRLKDITDLFLDTGIGPDSYAIIELKMIDEIIANKEGSRRSLFEEASGISKYKLRKKQTFNKLKETEADLSRVDDLMFEIEKNLKTLENQAKKAERYYRLKDQYKELSIMLASFRITGFRTELERLDEQELQQSTNRASLATEMDKLETLLQKLKFDSVAQERNLSVQQKATNEFVGKIRNYESEKKVKNEQLRFLQDKEKRLSEELEKDRQQFKHVLYNIKRLNEERLQEEQLFEKIKAELNGLKEEVDEMRIQQQSSKAGLDQLNKQTTEQQNLLYKTEKDIEILGIQKEALLQESRRNIEDARSKETELNEFNRAVAELENRLETKQQQYTLGKKLEEELQEQINTTAEQITEDKDNLNKESRKLDAKQNEYNLTKSLVDNLEGFPESIRFLKKNANWAKNAPLFSDVLFCKEEFRIAIENYLEPLMNHYVVETEKDAIQAIQLLSEASRGRAHFFLLEHVPPTVAEPAKNIPGLISALEVVDVEKKYKALCEHLLQNVYLITSNEEKIIAELQADNLILLSQSGKYSKSRISMAGGSVGLFEGKRIGRAKNLENLAKEIKQAEQLIAQLKATIDENSIKINSLRASSQAANINALQTEINRFNNELISVKTKQEQYRSFIENSQNRKQDIENKMNSISDELTALLPQLDTLRSQKQIISDQLVEKQQDYNELSEMLTMRSSTFNQENIRFHQQQNKVGSIDKDLEYRESQQTGLETRINQNNADLEKTKTEITNTLQHVDTNDVDLISLYEEKDAMEKAVQEAEREYYDAKGTITETENSITQFRKKREETEYLITEIKDKKNNLKLDLNALKERLSVEFNIAIEDLLDAEVPQDENERDLKEKVDKLKRQLDDFGAINPIAMEAYKEMSERYEFIQVQKKDLNEAKLSLLETIKEIDDTAKDKFMSAFVDVRENFIRVFRSLFNEEDNCDLILSDPENPLESEIDIVAKPKGKRPQSINQLSGGEKTLTATALLFSLYLLKPAPFCIFDEVDAPLDDSNIDKFNNIIRKFSNESQFIVVSHNKRTIASTDIIYGVTMVEQGVSRVVAVDLREIKDDAA